MRFDVEEEEEDYSTNDDEEGYEGRRRAPYGSTSEEADGEREIIFFFL